MTNLELQKHRNPDGSVVAIWMHPTAIIGEDAIIDEGAFISEEASIGRRAIIGTGADIGALACIGEGACIGEDAIIGRGAHIGAWTNIGPRASIGEEANVGTWGRIGNNSKTLQPISIARLGDDRDGWRVTLTREFLQIGCEFHPTAEWWSFDDARIAKMDRGALRWWKKYKPVLQAMAQAQGWMEAAE